MPNLTRTKLSQIADLLDESFFTSAAFSIETFDDTDKIVRIVFKDNTKYFVELRYESRPVGGMMVLASALYGDPGKTSRDLIVEQSPGDFTEVESERVESFPQFLEALPLWTERIKNEYLVVSLFQERFEKFQVELNRRLDEHLEDGDAHFSENERFDLYEKLNQFQDRIEELEKERRFTRAELDKIQEVIKDLERAAHVMSKRSWFRTACSKFYSLSIRALSSQSGQKLLEGAVERFLDGTK